MNVRIINFRILKIFIDHHSIDTLLSNKLYTHKISSLHLERSKQDIRSTHRKRSISKHMLFTYVYTFVFQISSERFITMN